MKNPLRMEAGARISSAWKGFLRLYFCFAIASSFSGTFINTYLIRATGSSAGVMVFNIVLAGVQPFVMLAAVRLMRLKGALFSQSIGMGLYAMAFLVLGVLGESAIPYIQWTAAVISAANAFFFTTYALQLLAYTDDGNRDACYGVQNALGGLIGIVLPPLTGILLASFRDFTGYRIIFLLGLVVAAAAAFIALRLEPVSNMSPEVHLGRALRVLLTKKPARAAMLASAANGFYGGTMSFFLNVLIYSIVRNEALIGGMGTATSLIGIAASMLYSRLVRPENRMKSILISLGVMIAATCALMLNVSLAGLIVFQLLLSAVSCFFLNPPTTAYFGVVEQMEELRGLGSEVHALREFWYGGGRVLGILVTILLSDLENGIGLIILIILGVQVIPAFLLKRMKIEGR